MVRRPNYPIAILFGGPNYLVTLLLFLLFLETWASNVVLCIAAPVTGMKSHQGTDFFVSVSYERPGAFEGMEEKSFFVWTILSRLKTPEFVHCTSGQKIFKPRGGIPTKHGKNEEFADSATEAHGRSHTSAESRRSLEESRHQNVVESFLESDKVFTLSDISEKCQVL